MATSDATTAGRLMLPRALAEELLAEARRQAPLECCGLLGGQGERVEAILPAVNALASSTAYEIAPQELFVLFRRLRAENLELVGIYHSHPASDNSPSARDLERAYYPEAAYVIISLVSEPAIRAFRIQGGKAGELRVEVAG